MGMRFQLRPGSIPTASSSTFTCSTATTSQQEAIGLFGVNLVYGAFHHHDDPDAFIRSLTDNVGPTGSKWT